MISVHRSLNRSILNATAAVIQNVLYHLDLFDEGPVVMVRYFGWQGIEDIHHLMKTIRSPFHFHGLHVSETCFFGNLILASVSASLPGVPHQ